MIKEMTIEEYNENRKICLFVYRKYFKCFSKYKDDLVQCGIINIANYIEKFNEEKSSLLNFKMKYAKYGMLSFLSSLFRFGVKNKQSKLDYPTISLDSIVPGTNDFKEADIIEDLDMKIYFENFVNNDCIRACINNALYQCCKYKYNRFLGDSFSIYKNYYPLKKQGKINQKKYDVLKYFLKCQSVSETAIEFNLSKQCVSRFKIDFENCLKNELIKGGYFD